MTESQKRRIVECAEACERAAFMAHDALHYGTGEQLEFWDNSAQHWSAEAFKAVAP